MIKRLCHHNHSFVYIVAAFLCTPLLLPPTWPLAPVWHLAKYLSTCTAHPIIPRGPRGIVDQHLSLLSSGIRKSLCSRDSMIQATAEETSHLRESICPEKLLQLHNVFDPDYGRLGPVRPRTTLRQPDLHPVVPGGRYGHHSC